MDIFEGKNKRYCKRLTKLGRNIVLTNKASRRHVCCEVCKLKSRALSHEPSSDCVIARAKGPVKAQASYGNITVLSHLNTFREGTAICTCAEFPYLLGDTNRRVRNTRYEQEWILRVRNSGYRK